MKYFRLLLLLALAAAGCAQQPAERDTYVIVHGAWGGGWDWRTIDSMLTAHGHRVYRPSLTGLGERSHLASPDIGLETHINDVVNLVVWEELDDVTLVGHSYGGVVAAGAADRLGERVKRVILVDALVADSGESALDVSHPRLAQLVREAMRDGMLAPDWIRPDAPPPGDVPHPAKTFTDPLVLRQKQFSHPSVLYILTEDPNQSPDLFEHAARRAEERGWHVVRIPGDHVPQRSQPGRLLPLLLRTN